MQMHPTYSQKYAKSIDEYVDKLDSLDEALFILSR